MITLDSYIENNNIKHIKILKIDVEWAEKLVFEWAKNALKKWIIDIVYWESNHLISQDSKSKILSMLKSMKYTNFEFDCSEKSIIPYNNSDNCLFIKSDKIDLVKNILKQI